VPESKSFSQTTDAVIRDSQESKTTKKALADVLDDQIKSVEISNEHIFRVYVSDDKAVEALLQCLRESMKGKRFMFNGSIKYEQWQKIQND
jgi:gamma-glutamyl phosphate reductase